MKEALRICRACGKEGPISTLRPVEFIWRWRAVMYECKGGCDV